MASIYCYFHSPAGVECWRNLHLRVFNPRGAKLNHLNFHTLEVVSRYRDPHLQVAEN